MSALICIAAEVRFHKEEKHTGYQYDPGKAYSVGISCESVLCSNCMVSIQLQVLFCLFAKSIFLDLEWSNSTICTNTQITQSSEWGSHLAQDLQRHVDLYKLNCVGVLQEVHCGRSGYHFHLSHKRPGFSPSRTHLCFYNSAAATPTSSKLCNLIFLKCAFLSFWQLSKKQQ